jgi:UTP-glucose-1-phosphate uridylyltransferase
MPVAAEETHKYGILSVTSREGALLKADGMVEKPKAQDAPSQEAVVGRYVLDASIFDMLATQPPGAGNEIQLTDAINTGAGTVGLSGLRFSGRRFDCGAKAGMLRAVLHIASQDPEYDDVLDEFITTTDPSLAA